MLSYKDINIALAIELLRRSRSAHSAAEETSGPRRNIANEELRALIAQYEDQLQCVCDGLGKLPDTINEHTLLGCKN